MLQIQDFLFRKVRVTVLRDAVGHPQIIFGRFFVGRIFVDGGKSRIR